MPGAAAILFVILSACVGLFHLALLFGTSWGELTMGGRWPGRLPVQGRIIAALSAALMVLFSLIIMSRAGLILSYFHEPSQRFVWGIVAYCTLGCIANAMTPSVKERKLWLPVVVCLLACSLIVALS